MQNSQPTLGFRGNQLICLLDGSFQSQAPKSNSTSPRKLFLPKVSLCQTEILRLWFFRSSFSILYCQEEVRKKKIKTSWIFTYAVSESDTVRKKSLCLFIHTCPLLHFRKQKHHNKTQLFPFYFCHLKVIYGSCLFTRSIKPPAFLMLDPETTAELMYQWKHTVSSAEQSLSC